MVHVIIGIVLLLIAFSIVLYFVKSVLWGLFKVAIVVSAVAVVLYIIPIDWSQLTNEENIKSIKNAYNKTVTMIKE